MSNPSQAPSYLRHRAARGRRIAKILHNRAIAVLLEDFAHHLDLEALVAETLVNPLAPSGMPARLQ